MRLSKSPFKFKFGVKTGSFFRILAIQCVLNILMLNGNQALAVNRVSVATGNYSQAATWSPAGIPQAGDQLTIQNGHVVTVDANSEAGQINVANGGKLTFSPSKKLTIHTSLMVYGIAEIVDGDLDLVTPGSVFTIGATGSLTWSPANNTAAGSSLFTNGIEFFHPASTLIIKKWYNYSNVPLGSVVTGNFGNLTLNTLTSGLLYEWNQNNEFQNHVILGKLTIDQGWIVLDKSGTITNTTIGSIYLNNINSYLDLHSGSHPGSFSVTTSSITNIGGKINGIYNGDGNMHLQVNGDFTNLGNTELIYNSGISGLGNGNASMQVTGKFYQTAGDFRGIFNISSTSSGKVDLDFGSVKLTGGVFMGQYSCHTAGNNSTIHIDGDLDIEYSSSNSKFRGNGLTTLSGTNNNLSLLLTVDGNLSVKGPQAAEFTSSGSTGPETTVIKGTSRFEGCTSNFNYGTHSTTLSMFEDVDIAGGTVYLSRTNGSLTALLLKNLNIHSGNVSVSGGTGNCNMIIHGDYNQSGGSLFFHNNNTVGTPNIIYTTVYGDFYNLSGFITFDNSTSSTAQHHLSLNGEIFSTSGNAVINSMVNATNPMYGIIHFDREGEMQYSQNGILVQVRYVQQVVNANCNLKVVNGNMQAAESIRQETDMILVSDHGILDLGEHQIYANNLNLYSSVYIDENGRLRLAHENGLYNGTSNAAVNAQGNMLISMNAISIVEYYGTKSQIVTGIGLGNATTVNQQYGILEINKSRRAATLNANQVTARTSLYMNEGELNLNGYNITINSGIPAALTSGGGYILSEGNAVTNGSMVKWRNVSQGVHTIPFGISATQKIPFSFTPTSGFGNDFSVSTRGTGSDNRPLTNGVVHLNFKGAESGNTKIIDRWYQVTAPGVKANITASYLGEENTTNANLANKNFSVIGWTGIEWKMLGGSGNGSTSSTGSVTANSIANWGALLLVSSIKLEAADILNFNATLIDNHVEVVWTALANVAPEKYTVERSEDDIHFDDLFDKQAQPTSSSPISYKGNDNHPIAGTSYYRLREKLQNGNLKYSQSVQILNLKSYSTGVEILSVNPNPFSSGFTAWYQIPEAGDVEIKLTGSSGQVVYSKINQSSEGKNSFEFSEGDKLSPGIYILTISNGKSTKNYKLFNI